MRELNFIDKRLPGITIGAVVILVSLSLIFVKGLNFGVDFSGGVLLETRFKDTPSTQDLRNLFKKEANADVTAQRIENEDVMLLRAGASDENGSGVVERYREIIGAAYPDVEFLKAEYVGPKVGRELIERGALAAGLAFFAMLVYIWLRFEWQYGVAGLAALLHDAIACLGFFALTGIEFNLSSVAAILTVIGYSINDSVVLFDRIRDYLRRFRSVSVNRALNKSMNLNMRRTILTSLTTAAALTALVAFGGHVIASFSVVALFGVIIGTFSSFFIATPLLTFTGLSREPEEGTGLAT